MTGSASNPESRDSPMRNCASEVWSGACHRAAQAPTRWDHPGMTVFFFMWRGGLLRGTFHRAHSRDPLARNDVAGGF
jgi:hypothetical protein